MESVTYENQITTPLIRLDDPVHVDEDIKTYPAQNESFTGCVRLAMYITHQMIAALWL